MSMNKEWLITEVRQVRHIFIPNNLKEFEEICQTTIFLLQLSVKFNWNQNKAILSFMMYVIFEYINQQSNFPIELEKVTNFVNRINAVFNEYIKRSNITFTEFFTVVTATHIIHRLTDRKLIKITNNNLQTRPLLSYDLDEIENEINIWFQIGFKVLKQDVTADTPSELATPFAWLEMIDVAKLYVPRNIIYAHGGGVERISAGERAFIELETIKAIRYYQYQLCPKKKLAASMKLRTVYTIDELCIRWKTNKKNIIAACHEGSFLWGYLNLSKEMRLHDGRLPGVVIDISDPNLQRDYPYSFNGYARLAKKSILSSHIDLTHFYTNETLKQDRYSGVSIVPPFCKQILGIYQYITVLSDVEPILYFMEDEIHAYELTDHFINKFTFHNKPIKVKNKAAYIENGRLSGDVRTKEAEKHWEQIKPALFKMAQDLYRSAGKKISGNKVAVFAAQHRKIIVDSQVSTTGKKIRGDKDFSMFVIPKK